MGLFERVFRGSDEMVAKAQQELDSVIAELGESAPMSMPTVVSNIAAPVSCILPVIFRFFPVIFRFFPVISVSVFSCASLIFRTRF